MPPLTMEKTSGEKDGQARAKGLGAAGANPAKAEEILARVCAASPARSVTFSAVCWEMPSSSVEAFECSTRRLGRDGKGSFTHAQTDESPAGALLWLALEMGLLDGEEIAALTRGDIDGGTLEEGVRRGVTPYEVMGVRVTGKGKWKPSAVREGAKPSKT